MTAAARRPGQLGVTAIADDFFAGLQTFESLIATSHPRRAVRRFVVYGGNDAQDRAAATVVPWSHLDDCQWWDP